MNTDSSNVDDPLRPALSVTQADVEELLAARQRGTAGFHRNIDPLPVIPADESAVTAWAGIPETERARWQQAEAELYRSGRIGEIIMAGGEATRFGGPKTFVRVAPELGEFLEIKAANLRYIRKTFAGTPVPMYLLTSEKRLAEFQQQLAARQYYGLSPDDFLWYVQGTVDSFIPTHEELQACFKDPAERAINGNFVTRLREIDPDGIYRFLGDRRRMPAGHFDAIAAFVISGRLTDALARGIEYAPVFNIDNLQAVLRNNGLMAHFAESDADFAFVLAEKNLVYQVTDRGGRELPPKVIVRFRDGTVSFDGVTEHDGEAVSHSTRFIVDSVQRRLIVEDAASGKLLDVNVKVKAETGGTLVQPVDSRGRPHGPAVMREGFTLPSDFDHAGAPFFNTNTVLVRLRSLPRFLGTTPEALARMSFDQRSDLVRQRLVKRVKPHFEFKSHEVDGEFPDIGVVKDGRTKIPVAQLTRIMLQVAEISEARIGYYFFPRKEVFAPVKEPEDMISAASTHMASLRAVMDHDRPTAG